MDGHNLDWTRDLPGKMAEKWPKDEQGNFVEAAYLTTCTQLDLGDAIVTGMLDSFDIPYVKKYRITAISAIWCRHKRGGCGYLCARDHARGCQEHT